jgi:tRNA-2-methylthio-N6-dimethylallyladenosine synthase
MTAMKTFHIIIYGCQMNYSDSARIKAVLQHCWWAHVDDIAQADVVILDTCSVRQKSEDKVRGQLTELKPTQKVWLTGCMIQHNLNLKKAQTTKSKKYPKGNFLHSLLTNEPTLVWLVSLEEDTELKAIARAFAQETDDQTGNLLYINHAFDPLFRQMQAAFPNVELFFRINDTWFLPLIMKRLGYAVTYESELTNEYLGIIPQNANMLFKEKTKTAYLPISTGCSQFCAYCIVPYARGLEKHRPVDEIIAEAKAHLASGAEEIVLLGQIVNKHPDFCAILQGILALPGLVWLRYTSPYPTYFSKELFALHESEEKLCPHIHMPLQSGSTAVLKKMFRGYTAEQYREFVDQLRALSRPISITTDIIVWFCDESEEDFQQSLALAEYSQFDMIYMGIYSPRPGTYGAKKYEDNVPLAVKKERRQRLNALLITLSDKNNELDIGTTKQVMLREAKEDVFLGYTEAMKTIVLNKTPWAEVGQFVTAKVTGKKAFTLFGEIIS